MERKTEKGDPEYSRHLYGKEMTGNIIEVMDPREFLYDVHASFNLKFYAFC